MTNASIIDDFGARLVRELNSLNSKDREQLLIRIGRQELRMRNDGQERSVWKGPAPVINILGADVVVPTEQGERRGRVVCFGVVNTGVEYEKSIVVHVPASGTHHEVPGSVARLASPDDSIRIANEIQMANRLVEASHVTRNDHATTTQSSRKRGLRDPKLIEEFLTLAALSPNVRSIEDGSANTKVTGADQTKRLYVFKTQLRVDVSGFSFDHPGLRCISDVEARDMHLGKVRGQILFDDRQAAHAAFTMALEKLK